MGATTVTALDDAAARSSSVARRSANVVLPAPGVATARKSRGVRLEVRLERLLLPGAQLGGGAPRAPAPGTRGRGGRRLMVLIGVRRDERTVAEAGHRPGPRCRRLRREPRYVLTRRCRGRLCRRAPVVVAVLRRAQALVDLLADRADRELVRVAARAPRPCRRARPRARRTARSRGSSPCARSARSARGRPAPSCSSTCSRSSTAVDVDGRLGRTAARARTGRPGVAHRGQASLMPPILGCRAGARALRPGSPVSSSRGPRGRSPRARGCRAGGAARGATDRRARR